MTKHRILVVDDEAGFTRMLKLNLDQTGRYEVKAVNIPEEAVAAAREFRPDAVLLDVFMPRMSGGDVAAKFKQEPDLTGIPIVFITAAVSKTRVQEHEGVIGGDLFIAKPASLEDVLVVLDSLFPPAGEGAATVNPEQPQPSNPRL